MIAVDKEEIEFRALKQVFDSLARQGTMRIRANKIDALSRQSERMIERDSPNRVPITKLPAWEVETDQMSILSGGTGE
jgi:hypothetical protein